MNDVVLFCDEMYRGLEIPPSVQIPTASVVYEKAITLSGLSKTYGLPGLRSGFVAGDAEIIQRFFQYRTYHGCAMPVHHQQASIAAWNDEQHVADNRHLYQQKFATALEILSPVMDVRLPDAGFYLWPMTPVADTEFAQQLFAAENITVLPGQYLSRISEGINPGENHIRTALVATVEETVEAAQRMKHFIETL